MNFKEYIGEATAQDFKAQGYGGTTSKTKFQLGDYVVVTDSQTKRGGKYVGQHGKIVGYKPFSMMVKYAVEFPDGEADAYFGQMIIGPFKDEATAQKYAKQVLKARRAPYGQLPQITAADLRGYVDKPMDTNPKFEAFLKQLLATEPFDMQWLDTPVQFSDGKYTISVLAIKPTSFKKYGVNDINVHTKLTNSSLQNYLRNNVCLLRQNNAVNGKLVTQNFIRGLPSYKASSPYIMSMMWFDVSSLRYRIERIDRDIDFFNKKELVAGLKKLDKITVQGVALPVSIAKDPKELVRAFKIPYDVLSGNADPQTLFEIFYDIVEYKGQKVITGRIRADENTLKYFEGYVQNYQPNSYGNSELTIRTDNPNELTIPPGMYNVTLLRKTEKGQYPVIKDFSFMSPNIKDLSVSQFTIQSLNGLPNEMDELKIELCELPSLQGLPKKIETLIIDRTNLKDFTGAEDTEVGNLLGWKNNFTSLKGVPKAKHYGLGERFSEKQIKKVITDREMVKRLDKDEQEAWGDIVTSL